MDTIVKREDLHEDYQFQASITTHPIIRDEQGVIRYQKNRLANWIFDHIDFNEMAKAYQYGLFSRDEFMQFYRDIGYSLAGFNEVWGNVLDEMEAAQTKG